MQSRTEFGLLLIIFIYVIGPILWILCKIIYKALVPEQDLLNRHGPGSYAMITGASSGQGKQLAIGLAKRGFNLVLIGSARTLDTVIEIKRLYPGCNIQHIQRDFSQSLTDPEWWQEIETCFRDLDISILINNVGQRSACNPSHIQDDKQIRASLITGTYPQIRLTQLACQHMSQRPGNSCIIFNTAQCIYPTVGLAAYITGEISVPYLSVYEAANAFGFYHANSIITEYSASNPAIDMLNIMPGAVITENTGYLANTPFAVPASQFCDNIFRLMGGNWRGATCAYWGHELSAVLIGFAPWFKPNILQKVGRLISLELSKL